MDVRGKAMAIVLGAAFAGAACDDGGPASPSSGRLTVESWAAFGDSLTDPADARRRERLGQVWARTWLQLNDHSHVPRLERLLRGRFPGVRVVNQWRNGEVTGLPGGMPARLRAYLDGANRPGGVIIMGGANDLLLFPLGRTIGEASRAALRGLDDMVNLAKARDVQVVLATIPPIRPGVRLRDRATALSDRSAAAVPTFNDGVRRIAATQGVPLVDVHAALACSGPGYPCLVNGDTHHLTGPAYATIADAFFRVIVAWFGPHPGPERPGASSSAGGGRYGWTDRMPSKRGPAAGGTRQPVDRVVSPRRPFRAAGRDRGSPPGGTAC